MATAITLLACLVALMAATVLAQNAPGPTTPTLTAGKATAPFNTSVTGAPTGGFGVSIQTVTLGPCVARSLHTHTATELLYMQQGSIISMQIDEQGKNITDTLTASGTVLPGGPGTGALQIVVYPAGRQHLQYNPTCFPASYVASFPADAAAVVAGTVNIAPNQVPTDPALYPKNVLNALQNGAVPTPFNGSMFTKAPNIITPDQTAPGTFSFPRALIYQLQDSCLAACKLNSCLRADRGCVPPPAYGRRRQH